MISCWGFCYIHYCLFNSSSLCFCLSLVVFRVDKRAEGESSWQKPNRFVKKLPSSFMHLFFFLTHLHHESAPLSVKSVLFIQPRITNHSLPQGTLQNLQRTTSSVLRPLSQMRKKHQRKRLLMRRKWRNLMQHRVCRRNQQQIKKFKHYGADRHSQPFSLYDGLLMDNCKVQCSPVKHLCYEFSLKNVSFCCHCQRDKDNALCSLLRP